MANLSWSVLWTAFALVAASPNYYSGDSYSNDYAQPAAPAADVPGFDCSGLANGAHSEGGCSKNYWLCWEGAATSQECAYDLMFNEENGQCDHADNVYACSGKRPTPQPAADNPTMAPVNFDCYGKEDGDYPFSNYCQEDYVSCVAGAAWQRTCAEGLSFDPENRFCNRLEHIIACGGSAPTAPTMAPVELDYECPSPSGSFALVNALCSPTYYICENNIPSIATCSNEMIWDDERKECRMPADIPDCSFDCTGKADAPYSLGCSQQYWWCWEEKATKLSCPEGMIFNGANGQCDHYENIFECTGQRVISTTPLADFAAPPAVDFDCSGYADGNYAFTNGGRCQQRFVSCSGGVAWELTCPEGLFFDPDTLLCDRVEHIIACGGAPADATTTQAYDSYNSEKYNSYAAASQPQPVVIRRKVAKKIPVAAAPRAQYPSYQKPKKMPAAEPVTRAPYQRRTTTPAAEPVTEDSYGSYDATPAAEPTTRAAYYQRKTTPAAEPITRAPYQRRTTTPAAEPVTEDSYGAYDATTRAAEPTTRASAYRKKTTTAAEPTTRASYYQKPAAEPTTRASYTQRRTTPAAEPITRAPYQRRTTTLAAEPVTEDSYGSYEVTTPAAEPTTRASAYRKKTTLAAEPTTRSSYYQRKTTPAAEPVTRAPYQRRTTTPAAEPTTADSYGSYEATTRRRQQIRTTTPAADLTTAADYDSYETTMARRRQQTTTPASEPVTLANHYQTTLADEPITTRRNSYGQRRTTTIADAPIDRSYYQATTPAAEPTTRASYRQKAAEPVTKSYSKPLIRRRPLAYKTTTRAAEPTTRASYYQKTTTPAAEPTTRASYYQKPTTRRMAEPTTRASYYQKPTTRRMAEPTTRASYYQATTPAAEPTTRRSSYGGAVAPRTAYKSSRVAAQPATRPAHYRTTTLAAPTTRRRSAYQVTTPASEPVTRRSYKLTVAEPTTRKPQFLQAY